MWKYKKTIGSVVGILLAVCMLIGSIVIKQYEDDCAIQSLVATAEQNPGILDQDIYGEIRDHTVSLIVPDGVDYSQLIVTTGFRGDYVLPEDGMAIYSNSPNRQLEYADQQWTVISGDLKNDYRIHAVTASDALTEMTSFTFLKEHNPALAQDYTACIREGRITLYVPYGFEDFRLIPTFETAGKRVLCNGSVVKSGKTELDFSQPLKFVVIGTGELQKQYVVQVVPVDNGLKTLYISCPETITKNRKNDAQITLKDKETCLADAHAKIRIRGNGTATLIKKSYKVTFDEAVQLSPDLLPSENLVLLANYFDTTMVTHALAFNAWKNIMKIPGFTPWFEYVNLFLNGEFAGMYMMVDQVEVLENKIEPGTVQWNGQTTPGFAFLVQIVTNKKCVTTNHGLMYELLNFKQLTDAQRLICYDAVQAVEDSIYDGSFMDNPHLDVQSFANWMVIQNFTHNTDAYFMASTYMFWNDQNQLQNGPIWDFDIGFNNTRISGVTEGFVAVNNPIMSKLMANDAFNAMVRSTWLTHAEALRTDSIRFLDTLYAQIRPAMQQNYDRWNGCLDTDAKMDDLRRWINERVDWLNENWGEQIG